MADRFSMLESRFWMLDTRCSTLDYDNYWGDEIAVDINNFILYPGAPGLGMAN